MADFLVMAVSNVHPDAETDRRGAHKKGDIIDVVAQGAYTGGGPFVVVRCTALTVDEGKAKLENWEWDLAFDVVASDQTIDGWRLRASNSTQSVGGEASLSRARVEAFLNDWGASVVSIAIGTVTFDVTILAAATSEGFWGQLPPNIVFTETAYDQATGLHTIQVDYSAIAAYTNEPQATARTVETRIAHRGGTVLSNEAGVAVFTITRAVVREQFRRDVIQRLGFWRRRRYVFPTATVDSALAAASNVVTMTLSTLNSTIIDRRLI